MECVFVALTLDEGRQRPPINTSRSHHGARTRDTGIPSEVLRTSWDVMDEVKLEEFFLSRTPMLRNCPAFLRGRFRHSLCVALRERCRAKLVGDTVAEERAWKVFGLVPALLLHRPRGCGRVGKEELVERANMFGRGQWRDLLEQDIIREQKRRGRAACNRVQQGQVSRARQELLGATLAPKTRETLEELTAFSKPDGGVRGIATGTSFRRLVAKTLARQFGKVVESTCVPFQFALSTRAGTDCVGHTIRAMTDDDPECTVLSIDGIGAYDHILRSAFLTKLHNVPALQGLLPFVRSIYARNTTYVWEDSEGERHPIVQAEGGEQGDPLMPLLFSLGIHDSLRAAKERMRPEDELFAYLDDVHVVSPPDRTRGAYNLLEAELLAGAGIRLNTGKTRVESRRNTTRLEDEAKLWTALTWVPDLQCAWQVLLQCAGPRCHHLLRTLPPSQSLEYAVRHDEGMMQAMDNLLDGLTGGADEKEVAHEVASLPMRLGGLGLRSARRMAAGAYWSSWADALAMIHQRLPRVANRITDRLEGVAAARGCLTELREVADRLDRQGFVGRPGWGELKLGARPPPVHTVEPGEWAHGWQYHASSVSEYHFRETVVLPQSSASHQAHLRSHSGGGSSNVLHGCPTSPEFTVEAALFRTLILERWRLPLAVTEGRCECGDRVDSKGCHRAACPHSKRLRTRAVGPERTLARVFREAGATVRFNCPLREMIVAVRAEDERRIEVLASGLPLFHGAQGQRDQIRRVVGWLSVSPRRRGSGNGGQVEFRSNPARRKPGQFTCTGGTTRTGEASLLGLEAV